MFNSRHLRAFVTVSDTGSVIKASRALRRAQSAVTRSIKELEKEIGANLFERRSHGMLLTEFGQTFLVRVQRAFSEMQSAAQAFAAESPGDSRLANAPIFTLAISRQRLNIFVELVERHNMGAVAEALALSESAVSQAIREVENSVKAALFRRTARGMVPTPLGAILSLHVKRALSELRIAEEEVGELKGMVRGAVRLGSLSVGRASFLRLAIAQLLRTFPEVSVVTEEGTFEHLSTRLRAGELDFIFGALRPSWQTVGFDREVVAQDTMAIMVAADHPLAQKRSVSLADLVELDWVLTKRGTPSRELFEQTIRQRGIAPLRVRVETSDLSVTVGLVAQSTMATALSEHHFMHSTFDGQLHALPIALPETQRPIGILQRSQGKPSIAALHLMGLLREVARKPASAAAVASASKN